MYSGGAELKQRCFLVALISAATIGLAACGGGGSGNPQKDLGGVAPSASVTSSGMTWTSIYDVTAPQAKVDPDTKSYSSSLDSSFPEPIIPGLALPGRSTSTHFVGPVATSDFTVASDWSSLQFKSGSVGGASYSNIDLPAATIRLGSTVQALQGFQTIEYGGNTALNNPAGTGYTASIQVLTSSGVGHVGMGQWKYLGPQQVGYFSGIKHAHGAFLVGQPLTRDEALAVAPGAYAGFSQAGVEDSYNSAYRGFDQLTANASARYDSKNKLVTVMLSQFSYWLGNSGQFGRIDWSAPANASLSLTTNVICTGPISPTSGAFEGECTGGLAGKFRGKFFGPRGQALAGTFALSGWVVEPNSAPVVGGFVVQRVGTGGLNWDGGSPSDAILNVAPSVQASSYAGVAPTLTVHVTAKAALSSAINAVAFDPLGVIGPLVSIKQTGPRDYDLTMSARPVPTVGTRTGLVWLQLCLDDAVICRKPMDGTPWRVQYTVTSNALPGPDATFANAVLEGTTYVGQSLGLARDVVFSEPSVFPNSWEYGDAQYQYTVVDSGILTAMNPTGIWYNFMPNTFARETNALRFEVQPNVAVGVHEGLINVSVCGQIYGTGCSSVERPALQIPYRVEVRSWSDLRPLSIAPEILATVNRRGSRQERLSFPLVTDPGKISVRWKIPRPFNVHGWGVGQGIIFGHVVENGQSKLAVYRETDGQLMWTQILPQLSSYGDQYAISASNNRIFVRVGWYRSSFTLAVYDAATGAKLLEKTGGGQRFWEQEFDHGWAVRNEYGANVPMSLWMYDDRTDTLQESASKPPSGSSFLPEDLKQIRQAFYGDEEPLAPLAEPLATQCGQDRNLNPSATFWRTSAGDYCFSPARSVASWAIPYVQQQAEPSLWPSEIQPLEAGGTILYQAANTVVVRDASNGREVTRISDVISPYHYSELARSANLVFIGTKEGLRAIDILTGKTMWTLPYANQVVGISNAGVLYAEMELNGEFFIVAINLRP
jgi:hypothetical protein